MKQDLSHHRNNRGARAVSGVMWSGLNTLIPTVSGLIVFILVSRFLNATDLGHVAFAGAIVGIFSAFSAAGFGEALVQRADLDDQHLNVTFWICLISGIVLYSMILILSWPIAAWLDLPVLRMLLPVIGIRVIFDLAATVPAALLSRRMRFRQITIRTLLASTISLLICTTVLFAGFGLWALVLSQLTSAIVIFLVNWFSVDWRPNLHFEKSAFGDLRKFGAYASGTRMVMSINVEQLLIGSLMGASASGLYYFAQRVFQIINNVLVGSLSAVCYPLLSSMQNEPEKLRDAYLLSVFLSSALAFPSFIGMAITAPDFVQLIFGEKWLESVPVIQAFCAIGLLSCIGILQSALIRSRGEASYWMWYQLVQQILTGLVIVSLAPQGITAVAIGVAIKTWIVWPIIAVKVGRVINISFARYVVQFLPPLAASTAMAVAVYTFHDIVATDTASGLILQILLGVVTYITVLMLLARHPLYRVMNLLRSRRGV